MKQDIFKKYLYKKDLKKYYDYKDISKSKSNFIEFLNQIESEFYTHKFKSDKRFVVCDRFQSLIEEMEELYWTKEQVIEKNYISPTKWCIKSLQEILIENNAVMDPQKFEYRKVYEEYCKDGIVSLEERDFILYAINMMKSSLKKCNDNLDWFESNEKKSDEVLDETEKINIVIPKMEYKEAEIYEEYVDENGNIQHRTKKIKVPTGKILGNETNEKEKYVYEFIPYEKIGPISLNKTDEKNFVPNGVKYLSESSINQVSCKPTFIDNPDNIKRGRNGDELIFIIDGKNININYYYDNVLESLNTISNDFVEFEYTDTDFPTKGAYSKKLGIIIFGCKDERCYFTFKIWILGKNEFERFVDDIKYNLSKPVITITSSLSKFVMNEDYNKEYKQTLEIRDNGTVIFDAYNFENEQKRHDYLILNNADVNTIINNLKNKLDSIGTYPITKDSDNWKIEILIDGEKYSYNGDISNNIEINHEISMYIRNLVKFNDLILLDGNK